MKSTVDFFVVFSSTICLLLLPLPCKISNSQSLTTVVGDCCLRPLLSPFTYKISSIRPGSLHSSDHFFSQQEWAQEHSPMALACLWRGFLLLFVFHNGALTFLEEPESFILPPPAPPPEVSLSHGVALWLWCKDNHRKQPAGLIHHKSGVV